MSILIISHDNSFRVLFDKIACVYFIWKMCLYFGVGNRAYFSVYYYTKCVLLKAGRATLKTKMCNIKLATQTIAHIIWCKTVADALKINALNKKNLVGFRGRGSAPWTPAGSSICPQTPVIGSRSRAHHRCVYY